MTIGARRYTALAPDAYQRYSDLCIRVQTLENEAFNSKGMSVEVMRKLEDAKAELREFVRSVTK